MGNKFKMTIRDLLSSSEDYSNYNREELIMQYNIIMNQYEGFKNQLGIDNVISENPKLEYIKSIQRIKHNEFNKKIIQKIDSHLNIMKKLIYSE